MEPAERAVDRAVLEAPTVMAVEVVANLVVATTAAETAEERAAERAALKALVAMVVELVEAEVAKVGTEGVEEETAAGRWEACPARAGVVAADQREEPRVVLQDVQGAHRFRRSSTSPPVAPSGSKWCTPCCRQNGSLRRPR